MQYARGKLDFVLGEQLYMCPSDMTLVSLAERIAGFNNEILVETAAMSPGTNQTLNKEKHPPLPVQSNIDRPSVQGLSLSSMTQKPMAPSFAEQTTPKQNSGGYEETKTLLTVTAIGAGIINYLSR